MENKSATLAQQIKTTLEKLAEETDAMRKSDLYAAYLRTMAKFHNYSTGNLWLIMSQRPDAEHVAGFHTWLKLGRHVRKGEKGIAILAPCAYPDKSDPNKTRVFFKVVYVFDITQTEGEEIPRLDWRPEEQSQYINAKLSAWVTLQGYELANENSIGGAEGLADHTNKKVVIKYSAGTSVLIHECAHVLLHKDTKRTADNARERETEAESVAYVVCSHFGIESKAPAYLATWSNPEMIKSALDSVQRAASELINFIQSSPNDDPNQ